MSNVLAFRRLLLRVIEGDLTGHSIKVILGDQIVEEYGKATVDKVCKELGIIWVPGGPGPEGKL